MNEWVVIASLGAMMISLCAFLWKSQKSYSEEVRQLANDVAWANKDLAEVKKDVEWLVWHFNEGSKQ